MGPIMLPNYRCCFTDGLICLWGFLLYTCLERSTIDLVGQQPFLGTISIEMFAKYPNNNENFGNKKDEFENEYDNDLDLFFTIKKPLICVQPYVTTKWNLQLKRQLTLLLVRS